MLVPLHLNEKNVSGFVFSCVLEGTARVDDEVKEFDFSYKLLIHFYHLSVCTDVSTCLFVFIAGC